MSAFTTIRLVAMREIRERGRSKAYLITSLMTGLIVIGLIVIPGLFGDETETYEIGSVGDGNTEIVDTAVILANTSSDESESGPVVEMNVEVFETSDEATKALEAGDVDLVLVDGGEIIVDREGGFFGSNSAVGLLQQAAGAIALKEIVAQEGDSASKVIEIISSEPLEIVSLTQSDEQSDQASIVAYFGLLLLYMAIILYGTWILTGVSEEKSTKVVEVMVSTIRPWKLLAGKIVGIGILAIVQFSGTLLLAYIAIRLFADFEIPDVPLSGIINLAFWFILGFLLYSVLFGAAGSLVGRVEDAQSAAMPMTLFSVIGFFAGFAVLSDPESAIAVATTLIPFTAPFVVPIRVSLEAIPLWQYGLSIIITVATIYLAIRVAGRIYAGGILKSGQKTKIREAWRAAEG